MIQKQIVLSDQKRITWKIFLGSNTVILFIFWLGVLTDYSWYDNRTSFSYSVLVLIVSITTFIMLPFLGVLQRTLILLFCLLTFLFALASIPLHRYHSHQTPVQEDLSPDGLKIVSMYCETNNGHGGMDHIEIIVRYVKFPFLQRDLGLYNNYPSRKCNFDVSSPVLWVDNNTIYVAEQKAYLSVDIIKGEGVLFDPGVIDGNK